MNKPNITLIGCGAIAEAFYFPALAKLRGSIGELVLVDTDVTRATSAASRLKPSRTATSLTSGIQRADAVILAVPHHLHYAMAEEVLRSGSHLLCEKPLTETADQARRLLALALRSGKSLQVNLTRRLQPANGVIKNLLSSGVIGPVREVQYFDGNRFDWPSSTGFYFDRRYTTKGVLLDIGSHVLDLVCWWLGGKPLVESSYNDSFGGIEAVADLTLVLGAVTCRVRLSRLGRLPNLARVVGENGTIETGAYDGSKVTIVRNSNGRTTSEVHRTVVLSMEGIAELLVANLIDVAAGVKEPLIPAEDVVNSIDLIDEAYRKAMRFEMPWYKQGGEGCAT